MATQIPQAAPVRVYGQKTMAFTGGVIGAVCISVLTAVSRYLDLSPIALEMTLGSFLTTFRDSGTWLIGFVFHLFLGGLFGLAYHFGFKAIERSGWEVGAGFGLIHWLIAGLVLEFLPADVGYGLFAASPGYLSFLTFLISHLLFGAVVGAVHFEGSRQRLSGTREDIYKRAA